MIILTHILAYIAGALSGAVLLALCMINKGVNDETTEEVN